MVITNLEASLFDVSSDLNKAALCKQRSNHGFCDCGGKVAPSKRLNVSLQDLTGGSISVRNLWLANCPIRVKCVLKGKKHWYFTPNLTTWSAIIANMFLEV